MNQPPNFSETKHWLRTARTHLPIYEAVREPADA